MNRIDFVREYCLSLKGVTEDFPFDETTLCFRVGSKIFAIMGIDKKPVSVNLKCEPEKALELREEYDYIIPGFHMNKKHWNTVIAESEISDDLLQELIDESYKLIFDKLPKKLKMQINQDI